MASSIPTTPVASPVGKIYPAQPTRAGLRPLFQPQSVAVIGATDRVGTVGRSLLSNLMASRFPIRLCAVTLSHTEILGLRTQKRIADIPEEVDLAIVVTPALTVPQIIGECVDANVQPAG